MSAVVIATVAVMAALCVVAVVRRARLRRRQREAALRAEAWAAEHPHLVALAQRMGPVAAGLLAASYPDALLRRWHRETDGGRRG